MPEHYQHEDDAIFNPETHHEKTDVSVRGLMIFIGIFIVFAIVTHIALWVLYRGFVNIERRRQLGPVTEMQKPADMAIPKNQPLLQPFPHNEKTVPYTNTPVTDFKDLHDAEEKALTTYGLVDQQKGVVRIPIDQAMQLTLQRGLPVQSAAPATTSAATPAVSDSTGTTGAHP